MTTMSTNTDGSHATTERRRVRVLLAEDDSELRALLTSLLVGRGYEVVCVDSGSELLDYIASVFLYARRSDQPDIVVSDIHLPGMSGMQILAGLRRAHWATPFVLMTAFGDDRTHAEADRWGARVLDKPFAMDALCDELRRLSPDPASAMTAIHRQRPR